MAKPKTPEEALARIERDSKLRMGYKRKAKYGLTPDQFDAMVAAQHGTCAICGSKGNRNSLCVDHDHDTNKVRGLLCAQCNSALGLFKSRPAVLENAARYIRNGWDAGVCPNCKQSPNLSITSLGTILTIKESFDGSQ